MLNSSGEYQKAPRKNMAINSSHDYEASKGAAGSKLKFHLKHEKLLVISLMLIICITTQSVTCKSLQNEDQANKWKPMKGYKSEVASKSPTTSAESRNSDTMKAAGSSLKPTNEETGRWQMQADPLGQVVSQQANPLQKNDESPAPSATSNKDHQQEQLQAASSSQSKRGSTVGLPRGGQPEASASVMRPSMNMQHNLRNQMPQQPPVYQPEAADEGDDYNNEESNGGQDDRFKGPGPMQLDSAGSNEGPMSHREAMAHLNQMQPPRAGATDGPERDPEEEASTAEQKEQEAAEASEAEAANQAALDEQQQQQRQIIMAQAQSEAKAIKEQQEALMRQQALQQQMLFKRYHDLNGNQSEQTAANPVVDHGQPSSSGRGNGNRGGKRHNSNSNPVQYHNRDSAGDDYQDRPTFRGQHFKSSARQQTSSSDIQFSDQPDGRALNAALDNNIHDEVGDYSIRQPAITAPLAAQQQHQMEELSALRDSGEERDQIKLDSVKDLLPAAQHSYGSHYKSLKSHQKDYYQ